MAKISKGISEHDIEHASNWYLSNENLIEANDKIIAFTEQLDIVKLLKMIKQKIIQQVMVKSLIFQLIL